MGPYEQCTLEKERARQVVYMRFWPRDASMHVVRYRTPRRSQFIVPMVFRIEHVSLTSSAGEGKNTWHQGAEGSHSFFLCVVYIQGVSPYFHCLLLGRCQLESQTETSGFGIVGTLHRRGSTMWISDATASRCCRFASRMEAKAMSL